MKKSELRKLIHEEVSKVLSEEMSWADIDKKMDRERKEKAQKAKAYVQTPQGKNAMTSIKKLISAPYGYQQQMQQE